MASGAVSSIATPNNFGRAEACWCVGDQVGGRPQGQEDRRDLCLQRPRAAAGRAAQAGINPDKDVAIINLPATELLGLQGQPDRCRRRLDPDLRPHPRLPGTRLLFDDSAFSLYKSYKTPGPDVLLTRSSFGKDNPAAVKAFMQAIFEANAMLAKAGGVRPHPA
jgi:taurine transport system substrate-binding protein